MCHLFSLLAQPEAGLAFSPTYGRLSPDPCHMAVELRFVAVVGWLPRAMLASAQVLQIADLVTGNLGKSLNPPRQTFPLPPL